MNCVRLMPIFDFADVDESQPKSYKYSLGFDAVNFNVPEGVYSSNPANPVARIREFKQMVQSFHKSGIRVVMDVSYDHSYGDKNSYSVTLINIIYNIPLYL